MDWEGIASVACDERVLPTLFSNLKGALLLDALPHEFREFLEAVNALNGIRNSEFLSEATLIATLLNRGGIEPVFLKGIAFLVTGLHGDLGSRWARDIDILVRDDEYGHAIRLLEDGGFRAITSCDPSHHHYSVLARHPESPPVELHRRFGTRRSGLLRPQKVIEDSAVVAFNGTTIRIPTIEHLLIHVVLHAENDSGPGLWIWPPMRPLYDFSQLVRTAGDQVDWLCLRRCFEVEQSEHVLQLFCSATEDVLGLCRPLGVSPRWVTFSASG